MGIETIILVLGVVIAIGISVAVAKMRRKLNTTTHPDEDPRVKPPAAPARPPRG